MSNTSPAFVFVHGAWHDAATWHLVTPLIEARGYAVRALDLPGAGRNAKAPRANGRRPLDLAIEPSPNAHVSQEDRTRAVVALIDEVTRNQARPVVLVGHSLGGLTVSAVAEAIPERVSAAVYLTALLLPPGMTALTMVQHPTMADSLVPSLFLADPGLVQAMRIDPRSDRPDYALQTKSALYGDLSDADLQVALSHLHSDEPWGVMLNPAHVTPARFGRVRRHFIRCLNDRAIPIAAQDFMIGAIDEHVYGPTHAHTLATSHSPFYAQPSALADILMEIAGNAN
ncbi:alpha/beta fold hydrolase [Labrys okinawensis]|uniref:alpha/beta fold hydrolase n=1 Tax=Labrys okinawensis TaxID=346911 RepID=UPI0039BD5A20